MTQPRVPKGTPKRGGQFAESRKPEGDDLVTHQRGQTVTTKPWTQEELIKVKVIYAKRVAEQNRENPGYAYDWYSMERTMIAYGGVAAVPPTSMETDIDHLTNEGTIDASKSILMKGQPIQCHTNTANLWIDGKIDKIQTGYALSDDGLWRQHSWGRKNGKTVETTEPRLAYFGFTVSDPKSWADNQL